MGCGRSAFVAVVDRAAALQGARFDLDVEALAQQVLQRQHLAGAQQRDAEPTYSRGDSCLPMPSTLPPRVRDWVTPASSRPICLPSCPASRLPPALSAAEAASRSLAWLPLRLDSGRPRAR